MSATTARVRSLPPGWHRARRWALRFLGIAAACCGVATLAIILVATFGDIPLGDGIGLVECACWVIGTAGFFSFIYAMVLLARGRGGALLGLALVALAAGELGMMLVGALELTHADSRTTHALIALGAIVAVLFGVVLSRSGFRRWMREFEVDGDRARQIGWTLRLTVYLALAFGLIVPFIPLWMSSLTPRHCALWTASVAAAALAIPLFVATWSVRRVDGLIAQAIPKLINCPQCGYPRPAGARCPECGCFVSAGASV